MKKYFIILIIGPAGAGKSTVSKMLATKFKQSVFIEVDKLRHMVKSGHIAPWLKEGKKELTLSTKNAVSLAQNFIKEKYDVIIEDVVMEGPRLNMYLKLSKKSKVNIILLLPSRNTIKYRDKLRKKEYQMGKRALSLHDMYTKKLNEEKRWHVLDTSNENPEVTTKRICKLLKIKN
jgi:2-phosphoglycerate kinase